MSDGDGRERDDLRPRIGARGGEVPQERVPRFRNRLLARVARIGAAPGTASSRPRGTASARDVPRPGPFARRCVIKARFVPMNAYGKRAAVLHLSYVERDGVEQDGGTGILYGPAEAADVRGALSAPMEDEKRQFRFIVSPEDAGNADVTAFTRRLMAQVQADLGRVLVWGAVNHWNTDNPHVHVIVRGLDEAGRDVTIDGRYLAEGMRNRAQAILTNELGPRTEVDVQNQLAREVRQERFTSLDRVLQSCEQQGGVVLEARLPRDGRASRVHLTARLGCLEQLGLAVRTSRLAWQLREGWVDTLRGLGQASDVMKRMHVAVPSADPSRLVVVDELSAHPAVDGVVRAKGLHDELAARPFVVIEGVDGGVYYTRTDVGTAEKIGQGDIVRLAIEPPPRSEGGAPHRPRVLLRRKGPPVREQVAYRGPTWLDTMAGRVPGVAGSFAREVTEGLGRREATVKAMGIETVVPGDRLAALARVEAKTFGARVAAERGYTFRSSPARLAGTLTMGPKLSSGRQYAVVTDDQSKSLWVLPASKQLRRFEGQQVQAAMNREGRLLVSPGSPGRRAPGRER